ncbi:uncharacterized protein K452DRAFT_309051 [Aplosporella prunicola CBS 121167]|uniref:Uncharacterized protein n=1 Tax=Aplosporella prunicola CBS 121167 TaxID=1176127 RepID=A0A6A6BDF4_9PEZI|nr:uncharacterized protein K452DRAFT_309051 [Aplosporella prunicola CBS 121167]KAF2141264.1 hypothetical protein K452DRAFT_309051 [Aplosporella prunicola CBS 121167]
MYEPQHHSYPQRQPATMVREKRYQEDAARRQAAAQQAAPKKTTIARRMRKPRHRRELKSTTSKDVTSETESHVNSTTTESQPAAEPKDNHTDTESDSDSDSEPKPEPLTAEELKEREAQWLQFYDYWIGQRWGYLINDAKNKGIIAKDLNTNVTTSFWPYMQQCDIRDNRIALMHYLKEFYDAVRENYEEPYLYIHAVALWAYPEWSKEDVRDPNSIWVLRANLRDPGLGRNKNRGEKRLEDACWWDFGWYKPPVPQAWRDVEMKRIAQLAAEQNKGD